MSEEFKIEKNIPIPEAKRMYGAEGEWRKLKVGESFFIPCKTAAERQYHASRVLQAARSGKNRGFTGKLTTRSLPEGVRVWRIK